MTVTHLETSKEINNQSSSIMINGVIKYSARVNTETQVLALYNYRCTLKTLTQMREEEFCFNKCVIDV